MVNYSGKILWNICVILYARPELLVPNRILPWNSTPKRLSGRETGGSLYKKKKNIENI